METKNAVIFHCIYNCVSLDVVIWNLNTWTIGRIHNMYNGKNRLTYILCIFQYILYFDRILDAFLYKTYGDFFVKWTESCIVQYFLYVGTHDINEIKKYISIVKSHRISKKICKFVVYLWTDHFGNTYGIQCGYLEVQ